MGMSFQTGGPGGGSRFSGRWRRPPMAEINVTPMVDVMLVLLIIFMVAAPLLVSGVPIDLPDSRAKSLPEDNAPVQITLDQGGRVYVDKLEVPLDELAPKLSAIVEARGDEPRIYVRADKALGYGRVVEVVGEINAAGFKKVALVSDQHMSKTER
ncbi:MAG: biopolymer transporter ExbD [Sphingomonadales bacterium]|nr:MAG: biopolymer transporter ExbD [Sphingomonadales bacterium]